MNIRDGSNFNVALNVNTGTAAVAELASPLNARLFGNVTVDAGATLSSYTVPSYNLFIYGNITNNGTITGAGLINFQSGGHTLQGTGIWTTNANLLSGSIVTLGSDHKMLSVNINSGATFDISNYTLKFTASNPITQNGTLTTTNSTVEYNGVALQSISTTNITYGGLRINNPAGATLLGDITIPDTLSVILGDLNLNGRVITLTPTAYMKETPDNTVFGTTGHIITTRNISSPSNLNVGGMGAILTESSNLGSTVIRRAHTVQTGLNGGTSIKRYYDITPTNNSGLNATLVFKYDDSELNGKPEPTLKLFSSTNSGTNWLYMGGSVNIATNEITLPGLTAFSRWSACSSHVSASISLIMEGFYSLSPLPTKLNMTDTVRIYLRNSSSPYVAADSSIGLLDSLTFNSPFQFANAPSGLYYLQIKHRNSLETWSKNPLAYMQDTILNYNFTIGLTQAYGNNMIQKGISFVFTAEM